MKILHTSDWHMGKELGGFSLLEDQAYILDQLCAYVSEQKIDVVLIAGDLFHRAIAPAEAVVLLNRTFERLVWETGAKVLAIAGNHDSPERLSFGAGLYENSGLYLAAMPMAKIRKISLDDHFGPVNFYLLPYLEPHHLRQMTGDTTIRTFQQAYQAILAMPENQIDTNQRNVLVAHGFFSSIKDPEDMLFSQSERNIGGADIVDAHLFDQFDYVAMGHLHAPQQVGKETQRYSGSPLKYSLSEAKQKKGVLAVDMGEKNQITVTPLTFPPLRDLRILQGTIAEILAANMDKPGQNDYIFAELTDPALYDGIGKLRTVFPNTIGLTLNAAPQKTQEGRGFSGMKKQSPMELFVAFYENLRGEPLNENQQRIMEGVFDQSEQEVNR